MSRLIRIRPMLAGALLVFAMLPLFLFGLLVVYIFSSDATRSHTENLRAAVAFQVQNLDAFFHTRQQQLEALTEAPMLRELLMPPEAGAGDDTAHRQKHLRNFLVSLAERIDFIAATQLVDLHNKVLASSAPEEENLPSTVDMQVTGLAPGKLVVTPLCTLPHSKGLPPHFSIILPIAEDGVVTGALVYMLNLQALEPAIRAGRDFDRGHVTLFDDHYAPVLTNKAVAPEKAGAAAPEQPAKAASVASVTNAANSANATNSARSAEDLAALKRLLSVQHEAPSHGGQFAYTATSGDERLVFYSLVPSVGWGVLNSISTSDLAATRNAALLWLGLALLGILPILLFVSWRISRYLLGDVRRILQNIRSFRSGVLPAQDIPPLHTELAVVNTALRELMEALNQSNDEKLIAERQFRLALEQTNQLVFEVNLTDNRVLSGQDHWGEVFRGAFCTDYASSLRQTADEAVHPEDKDTFYTTFCSETLITRSQTNLDEVVMEFRCMNDDGAYRWLSCTLYPMRHSNTLRGIVCVKDVHERKVRELEIEWQARKDSLTGLYNKRTTQHAIAGILDSSSLQAGHALLIVDLDNFKSVNDTLGHQAGDALLHDFAHLLQGLFRDSDIVGRIGGDEFMVLLKDYNEPYLPDKKSADIVQRAGEFFAHFLADLAAPPLDLGVSIGVAFYPTDGDTFTSLFKAADAALYKAKKGGKHTWCFYEPEQPLTP